jgi:hypothetical protein
LSSSSCWSSSSSGGAWWPERIKNQIEYSDHYAHA